MSYIRLFIPIILKSIDHIIYIGIVTSSDAAIANINYKIVYTITKHSSATIIYIFI